MSIYQIGYLSYNSDRTLQLLMRNPKSLLIDIRYNPVSDWKPQWNEESLVGLFGSRYKHYKGLGNIHYKLYDPDQPIKELVDLISQEYSLILLCSCSDYETCHRKTVYELLIKELIKNQFVAG